MSNGTFEQARPQHAATPNNGLHRSRARLRYEKQLPGHQVQIDVKFIAPIKGATARKHHQFTAIDDCTRR